MASRAGQDVYISNKDWQVGGQANSVPGLALPEPDSDAISVCPPCLTPVTTAETRAAKREAGRDTQEAARCGFTRGNRQAL